MIDILAKLAKSREKPIDGMNVRALLRNDQEWAVCRKCQRNNGRVVYHPLRGNNADADYRDFVNNHPHSIGCCPLRIGPEAMERAIRRREKRKKAGHESMRDWISNANVNEAFTSTTAADLTGVNSLASSATAGASINYNNNSSNLYLDVLWAISLAAVNTAPASNDAFYVYAAAQLSTSPLPTTGATTSNTFANSSTTGVTLNFPNVSSAIVTPPLVQTIPYTAQNVAINTSPFGTAFAFNGWIPPYLWGGLVNFSGMTIAASGNTWNWMGAYITVV